MSSAQNHDLPALGFARTLAEEDRKLLATFGEFTVAEQGQTIIQEGKPQDTLFLVISGNLHVQTNQTGRTILLNSLRAGDTIGEVNIFDPGEASATVTPNEFSVLWSISRDKLQSFMDSHPAAAAQLLLNVATLLSKRLRKTNEKAAMTQDSPS
tara:strand:+ start:1821 stop:2282 length:462 start_codon:yes stop_codon:yes gene_type:complete